MLLAAAAAKKANLAKAAEERAAAALAAKEERAAAMAARKAEFAEKQKAMREAAAAGFATLQKIIGSQAIHEIVPALLQLLRSEEP